MQKGDLIPCASCKKPTQYQGDPYNPEEELCEDCFEIAHSLLHPNEKLKKVTTINLGNEQKDTFNKEVKTEEIL